MTTIRIDETQQAKLDNIAKLSERSRNYVINQAIDSYLSEYDYQIERIKLAIKEADEGKFASDEDMENLINSYRD